jgi:hypothetical protein
MEKNPSGICRLWTLDIFRLKIILKMKKISVLLAIIFFSTVFADAQERQVSSDFDFTPYVSQIRVESRSNLIRLTWIDSPDARGPVYIFRSARPFGGSIPANIRPVVVRYGQQYYIDDTDDMNNVHYFIAASDISGRRYDMIIPRTNSISLIQSHVPVESPAPIADFETIQGISNIRARQDGDTVIVSFDNSNLHRSAILYRSIQPVRQPHDLLNAVMVQSGITSGFVDYPVPGFTWYYTIIYEDEISGGNIRISPGINATVSAVLISGDQAAHRFMRPMPLPFMTLHDSRPAGGFLPETSQQVPLSGASLGVLQNTQLPPKAPLEPKRPRVFVIDLQAPAGGEESALFQIIKEYFEKFEWESARINLQHYLSLPRSTDVEARARFYYGQTLYYTGNYREALWEFLSFRSFYPVEANEWIEAVLAAMVH